MPRAILLIDDDRTGRLVAAHELTAAGYEVDAAGDGAEGLHRFDPDRHAVVVTDLKMPHVDGMEVLATLGRRAPEVPVVVITAYGSLEVGVQAMRAGAYDVLAKPFDRDQLLQVVGRAAERSRLVRDNRRLRRALAGVERPIVAASRRMTSLLDQVDRVARSEATVLVLGESGTGKELVARRLHARSARSDGPFVTLSCAAVAPDLLTSELFGHVAGAFTGARRAREGRFRRAHGGTLFLDEVGELPLELQSALLRVIQERVVDVVGSDHPTPVDVRLVCASNRDLRDEAAAGRFRDDLYYRLAVVELVVPPLRDRPEDIPPLVHHLVARHGPDGPLRVPDDVMAELCRRPWPGNVRELENACERMAILAEGDTVRLEDLPRPSAAAESGAWLDHLPDGISLVDLERQAIEHALARTGGNVSAASRLLGVPRHILVYRLHKHGIQRR